MKTIDEFLTAFAQLCVDIAFIKQHSIQKPNTQIQNQDTVLTIQETSEFLKLTVPTIYGLVSRSEIPSMKKGKRLYFSKEELLEWLKTGRRKTNSGLSLEADILMRKKKRV